MSRILLAVVVYLAAAWFPAAPAQAQERPLPSAQRVPYSVICANRDELAAHIEGDYSERVIAVGRFEQTFVEIWVSDTGTWTVVRIFPGALACMLAAGDNWTQSEVIDALPPVPGTDS